MTPSPLTLSVSRPRTFHRSRMGVHAKLVILILLALVPLLALQVATIANRFEQRTEIELRASLELAESNAGAFMNYLDTLWNTELAIGSAIFLGATPLSFDQAERLMREQLPANPTVESFSWVSPEGIVLAATRSESRGVSCADRDHVRLILQGEDQTISGVTRSRVGGKPTLFMARAIRRQGRLLGIIVAATGAERLGMALPLQRTGHANFGLIDRHGLVAYRNNEPAMPFARRKLSAESPAWAALKGEVVRNRGYRSTLDGTRRMGSWYPIPQIGWVAWATAPVDEVLAAAWSKTMWDLVALSIVTVLSLAGALFVGRSLLRPVRALQQAALAISEGNMSARVNLTGGDELALAGRTFDEMVDRIQELEANRTRFLQIAAHELRNPMAAVKGISSLLNLHVAKGEPIPDLAEMTKTVEHEVDRLSALLDEMVAAFLVREGQLTLKCETVNLTGVIDSALSPFLASMGRHRFMVEGLERGPVTVLGDPDRLEEVVRNLLNNAVKYSPNGGLIWLTLEIRNKRAIISVRDNGLGIPKEQLARVFEGFHRASNLAGRDPGGMGLGLYICRDIVQRHGGRIWAESDRSAGTTFYVDLPLHEAETGE